MMVRRRGNGRAEHRTGTQIMDAHRGSQGHSALGRAVAGKKAEGRKQKATKKVCYFEEMAETLAFLDS